MKIVIDSNILFSALIKDSTTRRIILEYEDTFLFPSIIFEELEKYKYVLLNKSGMSKKEFEELFYLIMNKVLIISEESLNKYKEEAFNIIKDIDVNDVLFVACTLAYSNAILWSNDKRLKNQKIIKVLNTKELIDILR